MAVATTVMGVATTVMAVATTVMAVKLKGVFSKGVLLNGAPVAQQSQIWAVAIKGIVESLWVYLQSLRTLHLRR